MAANTSPVFALVPNVGKYQYVNATGTTNETLFTPGTNGSRIDRVLVTSNDTASVTLLFYITISGTKYHIGDYVVAAGLGYDSAIGGDALPTLMRNLGGSLPLPSGATLTADAKAAVTSGKTVDVVVIGGDF